MAEEGYKIWIRRQDTKAKITDENIWAGNNPGGQYSKQSSGQTRGEQYAYVYFPTWADVLKAIDEEETARLSFTISPATIPASGGNATITITANTWWTLTTNVGSLSPTSGNGNGSSTLTVPEYTDTTQDRQICVTATTVGGGMSVVHCITQKRAAVTPSIRITASQTSVSSSAANITLTITSNVDGWRISSNQGWATIGGGATGSGNDTRTLAITQNPGDERSVTITVSGSGVSDNVTITQAKEVIVPTLSLSANTANISADGGNITLKVTSNINGWTLSSNQTWARITNPSGSSTATRTLNIAENTSTTDSRSVVITVTGSGLTDTVTITQEKKILEPYLTISASPTTIQSTGGTVTISVSSNTGWTLTTTEGTLSVSSGNGNRDVTLTIPNYSGVDSRTITVIAKFTSTGEEQDRKAITQNGITPSIVPDSSVTSLFSDISCDDETVYTVNVVANIEWTAETNNSWITISNITSSSFKVSFSENGGNTRNGSILVKATDRSLSAYDKTISVRQVKCVEYYIRLKNASDQNAFVSVPCSGFGSKTIELLINLPEGTTWYAESDGTDWVNIQKYSDNVVVSFDDNDGTERTTQITISDTIGQYENVELQVKQLECEVPVIQIYDLEDVVNDFLNVPCSGFPEPGYIFTVDVLPFSEWIITEDTNDTWVHVSKSNSPAGVSVFGQDLPLMIQTAKVVIDANGTTQREATIIVDLADKSLGATPISISIIQSACDAPDYYIKFNDETTAKTLNADCNGDSETYQLLISIPEGTSWVAESDAGWVTCTKGTNSVTVTVEKNDSGSYRDTQVEIHSNPQAYGCSVSIEQEYCQPSGSFNWSTSGEINCDGELEDNLQLGWSNLNTDYPITFTSVFFDTQSTTTSYTITTSDGYLNKSWFNDNFKLSENSVERREIRITVSGKGLDGNDVAETVAIYQKACTTPSSPRVYVADGVNSVIVTNNYVPTSFGEFTVYLANSTSGPVGFRINSYDCPTGTTTLSGTRNANTGTTGQYMISYELAATTPTSYPRVTLEWKENSTVKTDTVDARVGSFGPYTATTDTVLSDFKLIIDEKPHATITYHVGPIHINNGLSNSVTMTGATLTVDSNRQYQWTSPLTAAANSRIGGLSNYYPNTGETYYSPFSCKITSFSAEFNENISSLVDRVRLRYRKYGESSFSETSLTVSGRTVSSNGDIDLGTVPLGGEFNIIGELNLEIQLVK